MLSSKDKKEKQGQLLQDLLTDLLKAVGKANASYDQFGELLSEQQTTPPNLKQEEEKVSTISPTLG